MALSSAEWMYELASWGGMLSMDSNGDNRSASNALRPRLRCTEN